MAEIRFHLDESVPLFLVRPLRERGIDVTAASDVGLLSAADLEHLAFARREGRVVVKHDDDFIRLHASMTEHSGIAYCRQDKYREGDLLRALILIHGCYSAAELRRKSVTPPRMRCPTKPVRHGFVLRSAKSANQMPVAGV